MRVLRGLAIETRSMEQAPTGPPWTAGGPVCESDDLANLDFVAEGGRQNSFHASRRTLHRRRALGAASAASASDRAADLLGVDRGISRRRSPGMPSQSLRKGTWTDGCTR